MTINRRSYKELITFSTFKERFEYLRLDGIIGKETFGWERMFNQQFYRSPEWKRVRQEVIARDLGRDLGVEGYDIYGHRVIIHHINPISIDDLGDHADLLLDPNNLITTTHRTHNAIHFGAEVFDNLEPVERKPNDTCPWKQ